MEPLVQLGWPVPLRLLQTAGRQQPLVTGRPGDPPALPHQRRTLGLCLAERPSQKLMCVKVLHRLAVGTCVRLTAQGDGRTNGLLLPQLGLPLPGSGTRRYLVQGTLHRVHQRVHDRRALALALVGKKCQVLVVVGEELLGVTARQHRKLLLLAPGGGRRLALQEGHRLARRPGRL